MERQQGEADRLAKSWYERAQLALQNGDEALAREALARRQQQVLCSCGLSPVAGYSQNQWNSFARENVLARVLEYFPAAQSLKKLI